MIDVGNDREFGFLYQPELSAPEATFARLLTADLPATARRQTLQLASFFTLPGRTRNPSIRTAVLRHLLDTRPDVRERHGPSWPTMISIRTASSMIPNGWP
jgi:hypothetical protein